MTQTPSEPIILRDRPSYSGLAAAIEATKKIPILLAWSADQSAFPSGLAVEPFELIPAFFFVAHCQAVVLGLLAGECDCPLQKTSQECDTARCIDVQ
jgi:hypothetical protein